MTGSPEAAERAGQQSLTETEQAEMGKDASEKQRQVTLDHYAEEDRPQAIFSDQIFDKH